MTLPLATQTALEDAAELFRKAKRVVVLTGAGISTPSGIPDFRSEGSGLWSRDEPMEVASLSMFRTAPERFFHWFRPLASQIFYARPNPAHEALAEYEQAGHPKTILTQNIDGLHKRPVPITWWRCTARYKLSPAHNATNSLPPTIFYYPSSKTGRSHAAQAVGES